MKDILQKTIGVFLFFASIALSFLAGYNSKIGKYIIIPVLLVIALFLLIIAVYQYIQSRKYCRYSVMVFVLNQESELLLVVSQMFGNLIIPSGMLNRNEIPHLAVQRILKQEVDLTKSDYVFDERYHRKLHTYARVKDCYAPFATQQEFITKHKHNIKLHYTFFYVCKLKNEVEINENTKYFPQFFSLDEIKVMDEQTKPFQDLIQRYEYILKKDI